MYKSIDFVIPRVVHYCWFGKKRIPAHHRTFIKGWKKLLPNYDFKLWNEKNSPMDVAYIQTALKHGNWANIANYVRLHAIFQEGGIYLDTDIQLLKSFDDLLGQACFLGFEVDIPDSDHAVNNAVIGAIPGHPLIKELKERLLADFDGTEPANLSSPNLTTQLLREKGLRNYGQQHIGNVHLYPKEYFYPFAWDEQFTPSCVKAQTYCIHFMDMSWKVKPTLLEKIIRKVRNKIRFK